jgi:hypothetical protein
MNYPILNPKIDNYKYNIEWTYPSVCVCVCVCMCGYLSGRDYVMECAGGRVESRPVRRVGCCLLSTVLLTGDNNPLNEQAYFPRDLQHIP